jgi:hypothetical protein
MGDVSSYLSYSEARAHLKGLLDDAQAGRPALVRRGQERVAVVNAGRLRDLLGVVTQPAEVVPESDGWSIFIPGVPVAADGASFDDAVEEMLVALREYAADWQDHLLHAPNHRNAWGLVQLVAMSDDHQLREWLVGAKRA